MDKHLMMFEKSFLVPQGHLETNCLPTLYIDGGRVN